MPIHDTLRLLLFNSVHKLTMIFSNNVDFELESLKLSPAGTVMLYCHKRRLSLVWHRENVSQQTEDIEENGGESSKSMRLQEII